MPTPENEPQEMVLPSICQNCRAVVVADELKPVKDIHERVMPGEPIPSGECPKCGAVCHEVDGEKYAEAEAALGMTRDFQTLYWEALNDLEGVLRDITGEEIDISGTEDLEGATILGFIEQALTEERP